LQASTETVVGEFTLELDVTIGLDAQGNEIRVRTNSFRVGIVARGTIVIDIPQGSRDFTDTLYLNPIRFRETRFGTFEPYPYVSFSFDVQHYTWNYANLEVETSGSIRNADVFRVRSENHGDVNRINISVNFDRINALSPLTGGFTINNLSLTPTANAPQSGNVHINSWFTNMSGPDLHVGNRIHSPVDETPYTPDLRIVAEGTHDGRRFLLIDGGLTWEQARTHAQSLGGDLATIPNQTAQNFILNNLISQGVKNYYWIGGYRIANTGVNQFAWVTGEPMNFTAWDANEPNNLGGNENHIMIYSHGLWNDSPNSPGGWYIQRLGFIVEIPPDLPADNPTDDPTDDLLIDVPTDLPAEPDTPLQRPAPTFIHPPTSIDTGTWMEFTVNPANRYGFRVFRATSATGEGMSISDFPITLDPAHSNNRIITFDPNVRPNTQYWYYVREVLQEARFDAATTTLIPEVLGPPSARGSVTTSAVITPPTAERGFIMMFIDNPYMNVNNVWEGIDPPDNNTAPVINAGRTMVPMRAIVEAMGGTVTWNAGDRRIDLRSHGNHVQMWLGQRDVRVNNASREMDVVPEIVNGRTLIPLRFVAEFLGAEIEWIGSQRMIVIVYALQNSTQTQQPPTQPPTTPPPTTQPPVQPPEQTPAPPQSSITLPNRRLTEAERAAWIAEYDEMGGPSEFELEVIRLINEIRREHNLVELRPDRILGMSTRFYAQTLDNLGLPLGHQHGPYGGSAGTVAAFGGGWNTANATTSSASPESAVASWMGSTGHRNNILNPDSRYIGVGQFGRFVYMQTNWGSND